MLLSALFLNATPELFCPYRLSTEKDKKAASDVAFTTLIKNSAPMRKKSIFGRYQCCRGQLKAGEVLYHSYIAGYNDDISPHFVHSQLKTCKGSLEANTYRQTAEVHQADMFLPLRPQLRSASHIGRQTAMLLPASLPTP